MIIKFKSYDFDTNDTGYIQSKIRSSAQENEEKILCYLRSGHPFCARASIIEDCFNGKHIKTASYTDGFWVWEGALIYYVENYHFVVDEKFVAHMKKNNWKVLKLFEQQLLELIPKNP